MQRPFIRLVVRLLVLLVLSFRMMLKGLFTTSEKKKKNRKIPSMRYHPIKGQGEPTNIGLNIDRLEEVYN